jgi:hypothetical protein
MARKLKGEHPPSSSEDICGIEDKSPKPVYKVLYTAGPGVTLLGWPAKGGLYVLRNCLGIELDFLGFNRFENTVRPGYDPSTGTLLKKAVNGSDTVDQEQKQIDEGKRDIVIKVKIISVLVFVLLHSYSVFRLFYLILTCLLPVHIVRMLGAIWYESIFALEEEILEQAVLPGGEKKRGNALYIKTGWPSNGGGVWVLNTTQDRASELGAARIYNARDMDERCRVIECIGGVYCSDPKRSGPDLP